MRSCVTMARPAPANAVARAPPPASQHGPLPAAVRALVLPRLPRWCVAARFAARWRDEHTARCAQSICASRSATRTCPASSAPPTSATPPCRARCVQRAAYRAAHNGSAARARLQTIRALVDAAQFSRFLEFDDRAFVDANPTYSWRASVPSLLAALTAAVRGGCLSRVCAAASSGAPRPIAATPCITTAPRSTRRCIAGRATSSAGSACRLTRPCDTRPPLTQARRSCLGEPHEPCDCTSWTRWREKARSDAQASREELYVRASRPSRVARR